MGEGILKRAHGKISLFDPPPPPGQVEWTTPGTYSWTCPLGLFFVSAVCVGGGGGGNFFTSYNSGGGGGGLGWKNNIPVVPGQTYTVVVGIGGVRDTDSGTTSNAGSGGDSYFIDSITVAGLGGRAGAYNSGAPGGGFVGDGGGNGGNTGNNVYATGGGGAGGYSGNGGSSSNSTYANGGAGSGGGGGAGGNGGSADEAGAGGGVGIYGEGASGAGGAGSSANAYAGYGGSGGEAGYNLTSSGSTNWPANGGLFGGGGGACDGVANENGNGAGGAVRIIWGEGRAFPATNTADV